MSDGLTPGQRWIQEQQAAHEVRHQEHMARHEAAVAQNQAFVAQQMGASTGASSAQATAVGTPIFGERSTPNPAKWQQSTDEVVGIVRATRGSTVFANAEVQGNQTKPSPNGEYGGEGDDAVLRFDEDEMRGWIAGCQKLADDMEDLAAQARRELVMTNPKIGEDHIPSARELADKFVAKAEGGGGIEYTNTAVGLLEAHRDHALGMKAMLEQTLAAYVSQEEQNQAAIETIEVD
ncbi:MAG: hypothetical protein GX542_02000 [Rhodococcus sp.]|nr:hypothetical protein [Rhodococcus sp. (in: high G+C Gram-positive bacteria)]